MRDDTRKPGDRKVKSGVDMRYFTVSELARDFGVSEGSIRNYERAGKLEAMRVGNGMRLFPEEAVESFRKKMLDERRKRTARGAEHGT